MWNMLKKFAKKEPQEIEIPLEELQSWFDKFNEEYILEFTRNTVSFRKLFLHHLNKTKDKLAKLEKSELHNPNITVKEIQYMEGNRAAFVKSVNDLLDKFDVPDRTEDLITFNERFNKDLSHFEQVTQKQYAILKEFFANESRNIAICIKEIENIVKDLDVNIRSYKLAKLPILKEKVEDVQTRKIKSNNFKIEIQEAEERLKIKQKRLKSLEKELEENRDSKEAEDYKVLMGQVDELHKDISDEEGKIIQRFSVINSALKKFKHTGYENEGLIQQYMDEPVKTLKTDKDLKILRILNQLKRSMDKESIEVKEKKAKKIRKIIINMDEEFLNKIIDKLAELNTKKIEIQKKLEQNEYNRLHKKTNAKLNQVKTEIFEEQETIANLKGKLNRLKIKDLKRELEKDLSKISEKEITIV